MQSNRFSLGLRAVLMMLTAVVFVTTASAANQEKLLHSFNVDGRDGGFFPSKLTRDSAGNLYGTTTYGGIHFEQCQYGCGTVFELSPQQGGGWTEKILHSFGYPDGAYPGGGVIFDAAGNLYGTTLSGGPQSNGTVFELSPRQGGGWTEKVLYSFAEGTQGATPFVGSLIFDAAGNLYGTTSWGGIHLQECGGIGCGTAFELSPKGDGSWTEKVLHSFNLNGVDGAVPAIGMIFDAAGNLYGTTLYGGVHLQDCGGAGCGTVFELSPRQDGSWTEKVLHSFDLNGTDGALLYGGVIFDATGNLYGMTYEGGIHFQQCTYGCGTVFELSPRQGGGWTEKVLHSFDFADGALPATGLVFDGASNLYGTTSFGGIHPCPLGENCGVVFELSPAGGGSWTEKVLHSFGNGTDGIYPLVDLIFDDEGNLLGTTQLGGIHGWGTVSRSHRKRGKERERQIKRKRTTKSKIWSFHAYS